MAVRSIKILYLLCALCLPLLGVCEINSPNPSSNNGLIDELQEIKLKIAQLESVLEESYQKLTDRFNEIMAKERLIDAMSQMIIDLESALLDSERKSTNNDERIAALENEVHHLWAVSSQNIFAIHTLKTKVREAEKEIEEIYSHVEELSSIVSEQWIQIRHLEQALEIEKMRGLRDRQQVAQTKCTFLKLVNNRFINQLKSDLQTLKYHLLSQVTTLRFIVTGPIRYIQRFYEETKKYHHELQRLIKQEMERNEYAAHFANKEVIFILASALVILPIFAAWMFLSSWFSR